MAHQVLRSLRSLARSPAFTLGVVATLALGIGASVAIFSTVDAVLLRSLPFVEPERLVSVWATLSRETVERRSLSYPDLLDLGSSVSAFEDVAAVDDGFYTLRDANSSVRVAGSSVTPNFFRVLGSSLEIGPGFAENRSEGEGEEVVLSHALWVDSFGADPAVVGTTITVNDRPRIVVGITPRGFVPLSDGAQLWSSILDLDQETRDDRGRRFLGAVARLSSGASVEGARAELAAIARGLEEAHPETNLHYGADLGPLRDELIGELRAPLLTLLVAVSLVLLVCCLNVGNLLMVRRSRRSSEFALRRALGASTSRLFRERVTETVLLGLAGGLGGVLVAAVLVPWLRTRSPVTIPEFMVFDLGLRVLLMALAIAVILGVALALFGSSRFRQVSSLRGALGGRERALGGRGVVDRPINRFMMIAQPALCVLLAVAAGLYLQSLQHLRAVDTGLTNEDVLVARVLLPAAPLGESSTENGPQRDLAAELAEQLGNLPGVDGVAVATDLPLGDGYSAMILSEEGRVPQPSEAWSGGIRAYRHQVTPGFFPTLGIPLLAGREFDRTDGPDAAPVAVVSATLAERLWGDADPIGRRFKFGSPLSPADLDSGRETQVRWVEVVGVVADVRYRTLIPDPDGPPEDPDVYFALQQFASRSLSVALRSTSGPGTLEVPMREAVQRVDRFATVFGAERLSERVGVQTSRLSFTAWLLSLFAGLVLLLAGVGIYGNLAQEVTRRTREIGLRMALGSSVERMVLSVIGHSLTLMAIGLLLGGLLAALSLRFVAAQMYGVSPFDASVYLAAAAAFAFVGLFATLIPALRASRVDPMEALRQD